MSKYHVELLAPAGNKEAFIGAVNAGADAIYLGGSKFGARAYADNFSTEDLIACIRYAHLFGRKVYLTVNTLMKEEEMAELYAYIAPFYEAGLDACIVQDFGVFQYLKRNFPQMELHASTQMTLTGAYGAELLKDMGATRIVPARELSLQEIRHIKEQTGLEIEAFIHGAMCYCYSGQCLFSSILGGRSGNRGRCAQPCRLPYTVKTSEKSTSECYPLSLKDMCTIEHIEDLMDAGIDSFKIEGRMKKAEYAAGVTSIYRKYIDKKLQNPDRKLHFKKEDLEDLSKLYIRSKRQDGYYYKQNGADMVTLDSPAYSGSDDALLADIRRKYIDTPKKLPISIYATLIQGESVTVTFVYNDLSVTVNGSMAEQAQNRPLTAESIEKQLSKLGDTQFEIENIQVYTDNTCFYSLKALNELRREATCQLEDLIIEEKGLSAHRKLPRQEMTSLLCDTPNTNKTPGWTIVISTEEQLQAVCAYMSEHTSTFERIYIESELLLNGADVTKLSSKQDCYIALPYCMRKKDKSKIKWLLDHASKFQIKGFLVRTLEEYSFLKKQDCSYEIYTDSSIYIWNKEALAFWKDRVNGITCPIELNKKEYRSVFGRNMFEKLVYGRIPMMITANCLSKTCGKCLHGSEKSLCELTDRYKKTFPVVILCQYCMNIIYNSVPISLHKDLEKMQEEYTKRLCFTTESGKETTDILLFFNYVANKDHIEPPYKEYTTGHEKRGVL